MHKKSMRLAAAAAAAVALVGLGLSGPSAYADGNPYTPYNVGGVDQQNTSNPALINPLGDVQLSIHKHLGAPTTLDNNGTPQTVTLPALQGVEFDVYQVYYDSAKTQPVSLLTNAGWTTASAINGYTPTAAEIAVGSFTIAGTTYYLGAATQVVTDNTGTATFTKPDGQGVYLVNESIEPTDVITNLTTNTVVPTNSITPASPFFVTLPMTEPVARNTWMYDVSVYPKNQTDTITKAVTDMGSVTTDNSNNAPHVINYDITTSITDGTNPLGMYVIYDDLDPSLTFTGASLKLSNGTTIDPAMYTVYTAPSWGPAATAYTTGTTVADGPVITIVFKDTGLALLEANRGLNVVTTLNTTVNGIDADGVVPNTASFIPNQGWWAENGTGTTNPENPVDNPPTEQPGIPSNEVKSKFGNLVINKFDPQSSTANMAGAVFAVYWDANKNGTCEASETASTVTPINTATVTAPSNTATFVGLQTSDWYNGKEQIAIEGYCVVETTAPTGYNLDATAHYAKILWATGTATTTTVAGTPASYTLDVANEKSNLGNNLPLTGGAGVAAVSILGLILVGGGLGYYVVSGRRRDENEQEA